MVGGVAFPLVLKVCNFSQRADWFETVSADVERVQMQNDGTQLSGK